jgi:ParB family chromosome partitioning protein
VNGGEGETMNRKALGKGIEALIPDRPEGREHGVRELPIDAIRPNEEQPRTRFSEETLRELAASIRTHGVVQPVVVRELAGGGYGLIAGERRLRAARLAGLDTVPAIVRDVDETGALELALVENLQREDLNPIDEARGYEALMEVAGLGQAEVAERVGKNRSTVANAVRLLDLDGDVQELLSSGALTAGHGRALLAVRPVEEQRRLAKKAAAKGLSVREVEAMARGAARRRKAPRRRRTSDPVLREWEERLQRILGTLVRIESLGNEGTIRIEYYSREDLERILEFFASREGRSL